MHFVAVTVWWVDVAVVVGLVLLLVDGCGCVVGGCGCMLGECGFTAG